ncbi:hypothetical protein BLM14_14735 [Phyllobacterium zundukense]|nr:hypothetical protein BLM14_14735 [Phyllobacterium zundukense]
MGYQTLFPLREPADLPRFRLIEVSRDTGLTSIETMMASHVNLDRASVGSDTLKGIFISLDPKLTSPAP